MNETEQRATFLKALFDPGDKIAYRPIETWTDEKGKRSKVDYKGCDYLLLAGVVAGGMQRAIRRAEEMRTNAFFGVCPRDGGSSSTKSFDLAWQIRTVRTLWADIDDAKPDEAMERCEAAELPEPSIVVSSGNGAHLYWLLDQPYLIDDAPKPPAVLTEWIENQPIRYFKNGEDRVFLDDPKTRRKLTTNWPELSPKARHTQDIIGGIAFKIGADHTQDLTRLLRLPGTLNRKNERNGAEPTKCECLRLDPDCRYSLGQFDRFASESPEKQRRERIKAVPLPKPRKLSANKQDRLDDLLMVCGVAPPGQRSEPDYRLCCFAVEQGMSAEELWTRAAAVGKFSERGREYFDRTWAKAADRVREIRFEKAEKNAKCVAANVEGNDSGDEEGLIKQLGDAICSNDRFAQDQGGKLYRFSDGTYRTRGDEFIRQRVKALLHEFERTAEWSPRLAECVVEWIRVDSPLLWEKPPVDVVNVQNGLLDVTKRELKPHSPEHLSSVQLPVKFAAAAQCPAIESFVSTVFPPDAVALAWELAGWLIRPDTSIQKAVLLTGEGSNGKSTFLELLMHLIGKGNCSTLALHTLETNRFASARLVGKLANICPDLPSAHLESTSTFKAIVGNDTIMGEHKHKDSFSFTPFARLLFSANHLPRSDDASHAFFRRWLVIPFDQTIPEEKRIPRDILDAQLSDPAELSGLLNHALDGARCLAQQKAFSEPESVRRAWEEFHATTDPLAVWLDRCTIDEPDAMVPQDALRSAYSLECERRGRPTPTKKTFGTQVTRARPDIERKQRMVNGKLKWVYVGLGLKSKAPEDSHNSRDSRDYPYSDSKTEKTDLSTDVGRKKEGQNHVNRVNPVKCDHLDPASFVHRNGKAYCPGCGAFKGNVRSERCES